jgi:hypothetical protein
MKAYVKYTEIDFNEVGCEDVNMIELDEIKAEDILCISVTVE